MVEVGSEPGEPIIIVETPQARASSSCHLLHLVCHVYLLSAHPISPTSLSSDNDSAPAGSLSLGTGITLVHLCKKTKNKNHDVSGQTCPCFTQASAFRAHPESSPDPSPQLPRSAFLTPCAHPLLIHPAPATWASRGLPKCARYSHTAEPMQLWCLEHSPSQHPKPFSCHLGLSSKATSSEKPTQLLPRSSCGSPPRRPSISVY